MIDAMRSFIHTGLDAFQSQQSQQAQQALQLARANAAAAPNPSIDKKINATNPAVEVNLSPQAQALMRALEERRQATGSESNMGNDQPQDRSAEQVSEAAQRRDIKRPSIKVAVDHILSQYGMPEYGAENQEKLDSLYLQVNQEMKDLRAASKAQERPVVDEDTGYRRSTSIEVGMPMEGADGLTAMERIKSAILYSELDRILGGAGVFFGGDQITSELDVQIRDRAVEAKQGLSEMVAGSTSTAQQITPAQEARMDAIYREIGMISNRAIDRHAADRRQAVRNLIESNAGTRIVDAGNASLGG